MDQLFVLLPEELKPPGQNERSVNLLHVAVREQIERARKRTERGDRNSHLGSFALSSPAESILD